MRDCGNTLHSVWLLTAYLQKNSSMSARVLCCAAIMNASFSIALSSSDIYTKVFHLGSPNWRMGHLKQELTTPTEINFFSALMSIANDISLTVHAWIEIEREMTPHG